MGSPNTIVAQRFLLQDSKGTVRAALGINDAGEVLLALMDARGRGRADMGVTADGLPRFELFDSAGNTRALVNVEENDSPSIALFDGQRVRLSAGVAGGEPYLALADEQNRRQVTLAAGKVGSGALIEDTAARRATVFLGLNTNESAGLSVFGPKSEPRAQFGPDASGAAGLLVTDAAGRKSRFP